MLYVAPEFRERVPTLVPELLDPVRAGRRASTRSCGRTHARGTRSTLAGETSRYALTSLELLGRGRLGRWSTRAASSWRRGWPSMLAEAGHTVRPRGDTTLVSWEHDDPVAANERAREAGVLIRNLPGHDLLRASVGAWNDETDLERSDRGRLRARRSRAVTEPEARPIRAGQDARKINTQFVVVVLAVRRAVVQHAVDVLARLRELDVALVEQLEAARRR